MATHIAKIGKYGQPRSENLRFQAEIISDAFHQLVAGNIGINIVQVAERQDFGNRPCRRIVFNIIVPEILNVIFLAWCKFLLYDSQRLIEFFSVSKIVRLCYPVLITKFLTSDISQDAANGNFYFFNLIKEKNA